MENKQNLHIHSTYADGKDTPEEMILEAIRRGFDSIGFSEHSYMHFSDNPHQMTLEKTGLYRAEIATLKEKYKGTIDIFCGMEFEMFSQVPLDGFDYLMSGIISAATVWNLPSGILRPFVTCRKKGILTFWGILT